MNTIVHRYYRGGGITQSGPGFLVPPAGSSSTLLTGLVASWKLDDLTDATGRGNTLTNNNTVTFNTGKIGNAGYFASASSQYLSLTSNSDVHLGDVDWTIGCWAYLTQNDIDMQLVTKDDEATGAREYALYYSGTNGNFRCIVFEPTDTARTVVASNFGAASTATWHCVIAWWDATGNTLNISINDGTANQVAGGNLQAVAGAQFRIGAREYAGLPDYWNGRIDNVNIWKKVLSGDERTEFYNGGSGKEYPFS